jgi:hypothetical protein
MISKVGHGPGMILKIGSGMNYFGSDPKHCFRFQTPKSYSKLIFYLAIFFRTGSENGSIILKIGFGSGTTSYVGFGSMNQSRSANSNTAMKAGQIASFSGKEEKIVTVKQYRWKILKN